MGNEDKLNADTRLEYIVYTLSLYNKTLSNVAWLIGDNTNTNSAIENMADLPFIGCASHGFNLATKEIMNENESCWLLPTI